MDTELIPEPAERPWIHLKTSYDVEAWIDTYNRNLQRTMETVMSRLKLNSLNRLPGYGICFSLDHGGDVYLHTTGDGDILLDVTPEAEWVAPLIAAATRTPQPPAQIWSLPGHTLTQLILGLSSLIKSSRLVIQHDFRKKKY